MRAVIYRRVSTDEQAASGLGLDAQLEACQAWARRAGATVLGPFDDDGLTGAAPLDRRPALMDALCALGRGDVLLVAKRDRLARGRSQIVAIEAAVEKRGARIASAAGEGTDSDAPSDVLLRLLVDAFAEYERLVIKARTRAALAAKARRGERVGQVPYGKRVAPDGKTLEPDPAEADLERRILEHYAFARSYLIVARAMTEAGVPTKRGAAMWSPSTIRNIVRRHQARIGATIDA